MKKAIVFLVLAALLLAGCQSKQPGSSDALPTVLDTMEYTLYTNIFYNDMGGDYTGKTITKTGTFATLRDSFNGVTRYYVWGYNDVTKCCDWQWEFVPKDSTQLPANGSLVEMTGVFTQSEDALDGYWFTDAEVQTKTVYEGPALFVDMGTMSATLERVQLINMQYYPEDYAGQSVRLYARVASLDSLEHPYYDGAWEQAVDSDQKLPAIGTMVLTTGTWTADARFALETVEQTEAY